MNLREESAADYDAIRQLLLTSFPRAGEADLVEKLREDCDAVLSLVAVDVSVLTGHVLFSRVAAPFPALGLGPVAVLPDWRRRGIAAALIHEGITRAMQASWAGIFVLGDPNYYHRFGFTLQHADGYESPYAGPHFMALPLNGGRFPVQSGRVDYAPAFSALD
jgi:putative acetyltransferase